MATKRVPRRPQCCTFACRRPPVVQAILLGEPMRLCAECAPRFVRGGRREKADVTRVEPLPAPSRPCVVQPCRRVAARASVVTVRLGARTPPFPAWLYLCRQHAAELSVERPVRARRGE